MELLPSNVCPEPKDEQGALRGGIALLSLRMFAFPKMSDFLPLKTFYLEKLNQWRRVGLDHTGLAFPRAFLPRTSRGSGGCAPAAMRGSHVSIADPNRLRATSHFYLRCDLRLGN